MMSTIFAWTWKMLECSLKNVVKTRGGCHVAKTELARERSHNFFVGAQKVPIGVIDSILPCE